MAAPGVYWSHRFWRPVTFGLSMTEFMALNALATGPPGTGHEAGLHFGEVKLHGRDVLTLLAE